MTRRPFRPMLALALLPIAGTAALVGGSSLGAAPVAHVQSVHVTSTASHSADDHGGARVGPTAQPRPTSTRVPEAGDDAGGRHGGDRVRHGGLDDGPHHS